MKAPIGISLDRTMDEYLKLPAASAGVILAAYRKCAMAAQWEFTAAEREEEEKKVELADLGTLAHALVLGGEEAAVVIDPKNFPSKSTGAVPAGWTNTAIRAARDAARAAGKIPILAPRYAEVQECASAVRRYLDRLEGLPGTAGLVWDAFKPDGGHSEVTVVWEEEGGILCKCRPDRLSASGSLIVDLKFTSASAEPYAWGRQMVREGHYTRAAWYLRGLARSGVVGEYVFLVCELDAPHLCSLVGLNSHARELGSAQALQGLEIWRAWRRLSRQRHAGDEAYGGYPLQVIYPEVPSYEDEGYARQAEALGTPYDIAKLFERSDK